MKCFVEGRGLIAERLLKMIALTLGNKVTLTNHLEEAEVVFLALSEEGVRKWLRKNSSFTLSTLVYDFSGFSKRNTTSNFAALSILFFNETPLPLHGIVSLPGCYASSILMPLLYIKQKCDISQCKLYATSLGGRSTLGLSKDLHMRSARFSSVESRQRHIDEIVKWTGLHEDSIYFNLMVADIDDGILTKIKVEGFSDVFMIQSESCLGLGMQGWNELNVKNISIGDNEFTNSFVFKLSLINNFLEITSFIHNLDFPIFVALKHLSIVIGLNKKEIMK